MLPGEPRGFGVASPVTFHLAHPQFRVGSREWRLPAVDGARMPKIAVNKHGDPTAHEYEIWVAAAGDLAVKPEASSSRMDRSPQRDFRACVAVGTRAKMYAPCSSDPPFCHVRRLP